MTDAVPTTAAPSATADPSGPQPLRPGGEPGTPPMGHALLTDQLALEIGHAVLSAMQRASAEGRLPAELAQLSLRLAEVPGLAGSTAAGAQPWSALSPKAGSGPAQPAKKRGPGTVTIRAAMRRAQELAMAPSGSDLGHLRLTIIAVIFAVSVVAGAVLLVLH